MVVHQLCAVIVADANVLSAGLVTCIEDVAHLRHRKNGDADAELVHLLERLFRRPWTTASAPSSARTQSRRLVMVMDIDGTALHVDLIYFFLSEGSACVESGRGESLEEVASGIAGHIPSFRDPTLSIWHAI